ncbi:MAG: flagellar hook-length control protein FliK [Austwickia sp.]|jgi:hypothetical protein|nr:MAG: flagellar hook-length control protein FliK [Austwickia sp.]
MTIRIVQDPTTPVAAGASGSAGGANQPTDDGFAAALRTKLRSDERPEPDPSARQTAARARHAEQRSTHRPDAPRARAAEDQAAARDHRVSSANSSIEQEQEARVGGASADEQPATASAQAAVAAQAAMVSATTAPDSSTAPADPALDGVTGVAASAPSSAVLPAPSASSLVAAANAAQAEAAAVASAEMAVTTQLQQSAVGQAIIDAETAAARGPIPTAAVTPTVVPAVAPPVPRPTDLVTAVTEAAIVGSAGEVGPLADPLFRAAAELAAKTAPVDPAAPDAGPVAQEMRSSAFGGAAMLGGRPYAEPSGGSTGTATAADGAAAQTVASPLSAPAPLVAPDSIGAASGAAFPAPVATAPAGAGTPDVGSSSAVGAAGGSSIDGALATGLAGGPTAGTGTDSGAPSLALSDPAAPFAPPEAAAAQHAVARAVVDSALAEKPLTETRLTETPSAAAPAATAPEPVSAAPDKAAAPSAPPASAARPAEPAAPPPAPVPAPPAHAPAVTPAAPSTPAAAPPPAVHSQILSAVTPALHRRDGSYSVELQLDPASLGRVRVQLAISGGEVSLQLASGDAATRDLLRQHMDQLRQQLADSGFGRSSVDVGDGSRGNPWQDAQGRQAAAQAGQGQGQGQAQGQQAGRGGPGARTLADQGPADEHDHHEQVRRATRENRGDGPLDVHV